MKLGIMQPYFLPYVGYYQLISEADCFIVYDNIQYTKKGWINRNRILSDNRPTIFTLPLSKGSNYLYVNKRYLSKDINRSKLLNKFRTAYREAPFRLPTMDLLDQIFSYEDENLFNFIFNSLSLICSHLEINTPLRKSSDVAINHSLKGQEKVLAMCKQMKANTYINPIGGLELYDRMLFKANGIDLQFMKMNHFEYQQQISDSDFVPSLSIIDLLMNCSLSYVKQILQKEFACI